METGTRILNEKELLSQTGLLCKSFEDRNEKETEDNPGLSSFGWIYFAGSTGTGGRDPYGDPG